MNSSMKIRHHGGNSYSVYDNDSLLCAFQGPMAVSAAITFIKAVEKGNHISPVKALPYFEKKEN